MFHLYFGAFDIVLYLGGTYFAIVLANAICDDRERIKTTQETADTTPSTIASEQSTPTPSVVPIAKRKDVPVRVSVNL